MLARMTKLVGAALLALGLSQGPAAADQLQDILDRGRIAIGVPQDFAPFGSVGPDLQPEGYDVDVARLIAENLGVEVEIVAVSSANRIPYLQSGQIDLVVSSLGATPERAKSIWFSAAYAPFFSAVYAAPGVAIASPADLGGKSLAVTRGAVEDLLISELAPEGTQIRRYEDNATTIAAYLSGQAEVLVTGNVVAAQIMRDNADARMESKFLLRESPCFIGLRQGEVGLLQWLNVFILHKKLSGELDALALQWFGEPLPTLPTL